MTGRRHRIAAAVTLTAVLLGLVLVGDGGAYTATRGWHGGTRLEIYGPNIKAECTLGFQVYRPNGDVGAVTAGHCFTQFWATGGTLDGDPANTFTRSDVALSPVADLALIGIGGQGTAAASGRIWSDHGLRQVGGLERNVHVGMLVCWHGAMSGDSCGTVAHERRQPAHSIPGVAGSVRMWEVAVTWGRGLVPGDSGAVVYNPNWTLVAGVTPAGDSRQVWFYPVDAVEAVFGPVAAVV